MADSGSLSNSDLNLNLDPRIRPHQDPIPTPRELGIRDAADKSSIGVNIYEENYSGEDEAKDGKRDEVEVYQKESEDNKDVAKPLLDEESVKIDIVKSGNEGEDTPTLPLPDKKKKGSEDYSIKANKQKENLPVYLFPFSRIKEAWNTSDNVFTFTGQVVCIIFQTVGWFTCVGGIPFLSLVMLIIGSIYLGECKIQPNIPIYLIVSGVIGTIQHVITVWTRYVPRESTGRLKVYRSYCHSINGLFHLFLFIWFILGCVWIYGAHSEVVFKDPQRDVYCHKTLYYFAFWVMNLSFILLGLLVVLSVCFLICIIAVPKEDNGIIQ